MNLSRRCILGKILTGLFLLKFPGHLSSGSILNQESEQKIRLGYTSFIKELQKSKNLLLQKKLKEWILQRKFGKGFDFHLRDAGLDFKEVQIISNAMMKATKHGILNLKSFSLSYNPEITDQGVGLLVKAFLHKSRNLVWLDVISEMKPVKGFTNIWKIQRWILSA